MTLADRRDPVLTWTEPAGINTRGTLIVVPGRGEEPSLYERFGRRIAADGYRVHAVADPTVDPALTVSQVLDQLAGLQPADPRVLVGSDTGALFAAGLAASDQVPGLAALVLAGLPVVEDGLHVGSWDAELDTRTACPAHRGRLSALGLRRGALYEPVPDGWLQQADLAAVPQPILGIHGTDDLVSPLTAVRAWYARAAVAELVSIAGGRHDVLNDLTHRTVAATVVLFLERLRLGEGLAPIATSETLAEPGYPEPGYPEPGYADVTGPR
jgi:alpha-beta hydrolase superfamily lysophospholipase